MRVVVDDADRIHVENSQQELACIRSSLQNTSASLKLSGIDQVRTRGRGCMLGSLRYSLSMLENDWIDCAAASQ